MGNDSILKVKNLNVKLNNDKIIENLSFEIKKGEIFIISKPNEAGETIIFNFLNF